LNTNRGEGCALTWPDWYCKVASNIDSAITTLFSISAIEAVASSYFSCIHIVVYRVIYMKKEHKIISRSEYDTLKSQKIVKSLNVPSHLV